MLHFLERSVSNSPPLYSRPNEAGLVENEAVLIVDSGYELFHDIVVVDVDTPVVVALEYKSFFETFVVDCLTLLLVVVAAVAVVDNDLLSVVSHL